MDSTDSTFEKAQSESHLPNKTTIEILASIHAFQCQENKPPNFSMVYKHQRGSLNPVQLKRHLDQLISVGYLTRANVGKSVIYQVTDAGTSFIENLPEVWSGLQRAKKKLTF